MSTNLSGASAASASGYQSLTREQIDAMTLADVDAELDRLREQIAAGPRLHTIALSRALADRGVTEPDVRDIEFAVVDVLRRAAADESFRKDVVSDYTIVGRTEDAESFMRAVAEVSAR